MARDDHAAGNRTSEQIEDAIVSASHDNLNRLTSQSVGGAIRIVGALDEPGTVTVQGKPVTVDAANKFQGTVPVTTGTTTVAVTATDGSGNQATNTYEIDQSGTGATLTYDANGNLTSDGTRTFTWDAENRLLSVAIGTKTSEFTYDGQSRRVRIVEKDGGATTSDKRFVWCELALCEERDASGASATKRFFGLGVQDAGSSYFYHHDHLGSVRELTDGTATLRARYAFDPWGRRTKLSGDKDADLGFTGHYEHPATGLTLTLFRAYDSSLGRWLSQDPIGLGGGTDFYSYATNGPTVRSDRYGLDVRNNTDHPITVIGGDLHTLIPVKPGEVWKGPQDGIIDPVSHPGQVFKTTNGIDATVGENGSVDTVSPLGLFEWTGQKLTGGWKDEKWNDGLNKKKDPTWNESFKLSQQPPPFCPARGR